MPSASASRPAPLGLIEDRPAPHSYDRVPQFYDGFVEILRIRHHRRSSEAASLLWLRRSLVDDSRILMHLTGDKRLNAKSNSLSIGNQVRRLSA